MKKINKRALSEQSQNQKNGTRNVVGALSVITCTFFSIIFQNTEDQFKLK